MAKRAEEIKYEIAVPYGVAVQIRSLSGRSGLTPRDALAILAIMLRSGLDRGLDRDLWVTEAASRKAAARLVGKDDVVVEVDADTHAILGAVAALGGLSVASVVETALSRGGYSSLSGVSKVEPFHWSGFFRRI